MPRLLILGATGFIGSEIASALIADGHDVRLAARDLDYGRRLFPDADWRLADLNRLTAQGDWAPLLEGVDIVVNAAGLLQSAPGDDVTRVQRDAVMALGEACRDTGVSRIVQISAAGVAGNDSDFMTSKAEADSALLAGPVPAIVLRPGLVIGRNAYGGTQLIRMAAALPFGLFPPLGAPIRCIALADVVAAVRLAVAADPPPDAPVDLVGEETHALPGIIAAHRRWLGLRDWRRPMRLPRPFLTVAMRASDALGLLGWRSPLRSNAVAALANGVEGDAAATRTWLDRAPLTLDQTLAAMPSGKQDRLMAWATALLPAALLALGIMWLVSGIATLADIDRASAVMRQTGIGAGASWWLTFGGAVADIALALMLAVRRWVRPALMGMVLLAGGYLLLGTVLLPALWADPLAPLAKVLPSIVLALLILPMMEKR
ncbi:SDR family oxidoreductase [uncultured Parasphingopyxis sp.]|uniref:SDR family oxidoreductase n=1 Tax=uncultured Parasphingopyxis sp. TaxID=1547918 RepID=UPI0026096942|nr:SDR family oxidoreductase [uncultured Parasphingopyxis sp.]